MACSKYKNCHYKSAVQFYNTATQPILATNISTNPVTVELGSKVTDTGVSLDFETNSIEVLTSGLYRFSADVDFSGGTIGEITVAMTLNGSILPETITTQTISTTGTASTLNIETVRQLSTCGLVSNYILGIIAYSDGTAIGSISKISGNAVKLA